MKIGKSKFIILIILLITLGIMPQAYAKTSIEIKPGDTVVYTNKTISDFFDETMAMKNVGEGLEGSTVDVHMATNTDWAIFAYFSNSQYGTNGAGRNEGIDVTIGDKTYKSTNGNITGMMNLGSTTTYTSGVLRDYANIVDTSETEEPYDWGKRIIEKAKNSEYQYVDLIQDSGDYKNIAARYSVYIGSNNTMPFSVRDGLFSIHAGRSSGQNRYPTGEARAYTFRPVFWN